MGIFKQKTLLPQERRSKPFRVELGWRGLFGLVIVCFCLFFWMFLLGIWAGQTILLPLRDKVPALSDKISKPPATREMPGFVPSNEESRPMNHNDSDE